MANSLPSEVAGWVTSELSYIIERPSNIIKLYRNDVKLLEMPLAEFLLIAKVFSKISF